MKRTHVITAAILMLIATTGAYGIFGVGDIVYDPTTSLNILSQTEQVVNQLRILQSTLTNAENTYNQVVNNAKMLTGKNAWYYIAMPPAYPIATNSYGTSGDWISSINNGLRSANGYLMATQRLDNPSGLYSALSMRGQSNFSTHYATMEINDGIANNAMTVTGSMRQQMAAQQQALAQLQTASLSDDPGQNTEVGILNKVNAATLVHAQTLQGTNQLLAAMTDAQTVELKQRHDLLVDEMNSSVAAQAAVASNTSSLWSGDTSAHSARLP